MKPSILSKDLSLFTNIELEIVRAIAPPTKPWLRRLANKMTRLGNGWIYFVAALGSCVAQRQALPRSVVASCIALIALHLVYPSMKTRSARPRPCDRDASLQSIAEPLDSYSFPSGHMMSLTAVLTPWGVAMPSVLPFAVALMLIMGWSRIATGHHYLTDVLAGTALGGVAGYLSVVLLAVA